MEDSNAAEFAKDAQELAEQAKRVYGDIVKNDTLRNIYQENPYAVVGAALGIGYVLGGGLATPFSRRLAKVGMKALFVPLAAAQLKSLAIGLPPEE